MDGAFFMSGPIERGALSGPLDVTAGYDGGAGRAPFSAPLSATGIYGKKKRRKGIPGIRKFQSSFSEKKRPWVVPVRSFVGRKDVDEVEVKNESDDVQWAACKAGEDRVHVVVSEEHNWLFVGIYDGFNGPDAPEFLMGNLYKALYKQLEGLFWDSQETTAQENSNVPPDNGESVKKVTFEPEQIHIRRRRLWEFLAEDHPEYALDLSGSERFAFSIDDDSVSNNTGSALSRRSLLLSKLKHGLIKHKQSKKFFPWKLGLSSESKEKTDSENRVDERSNVNGRKKKVGPVDHGLVLRAMSRALEVTEIAYLDMTNKVLDRNPELALMGSCLLVVLMRDEDVYVMNVGDSRAVVAQYESQEVGCSTQQTTECIVELNQPENLAWAINPAMKLTALQLSTDHSTSIPEEVERIKKEHPDDSNCIVNDRVKGRLKVTRAFGAGFLKQPKLNDALLGMFRNEYIGSRPYISCTPSLHHHKLCPRDQLLILSSDGLYQYLTNQEVVSDVENFIQKFPEGDPAQHLIEEVLLRAAKKAGMELHELLDIPRGDHRRKYHDDVTVMVISLEGRIWKSSGKYL
jgi:serine/threonine protein phosphatase PrpC